MHLRSLSLTGFKNYSTGELSFSPKINCFTGNNGAGKTNLLDAIYYLSFCKSFLNSVDNLNIKYEEQFFLLQGDYAFEDMQEQIYCMVERGKKKRFKRNKKDYDKLADHIGLIPLVMVSPGDINLIIGGSEERRKFMDGIISQYNREYLFSLQRHNKVLAQRNYMLKEALKGRSLDVDMLAVYDEELAEYADYIHAQRNDFVRKIIPVFQKYFSFISGGSEEVTLEYKSQLSNENYGELLEQNRGQDRATAYTNIGIHKDDLNLGLADFPIRKVGSQGQQKTFLVSLKLAQFEYIKELCGFKPILLLDDVFDKLDNQRVKQLISLVAEHNFGQIFITDTNPDRLDEVLHQVSESYRLFQVENATIQLLYEEK